MSRDNQTVCVSLLDKEYRFSCSTEKEALLKEAAQLLDYQMHHIRKSGRVIGTERIAVMAALNIAHELLALKHSREKPVTDLQDRIKMLHEKIDDALVKGQQKKEDIKTTQAGVDTASQAEYYQRSLPMEDAT